MILEKLVLENFRQFKGKQEIVFSNLQTRNVTLVHAENGFGKTALLNALLWGFYGHDGLTDDLAHKERILHEGVAARSRDPENTSASVRILFKHEGRKYTLSRSLSLLQQNLNSRRTDLTLEVLQDGETFRERLPQQRLQAIMPEGISPFLFFNGERIDHLAMEENAEKVTDAIQQMLGLKLLQAAIDDLSHPNVRGKLRTELRDCTSEEKAALLDEQADVDQKLADTAEKKKLQQDILLAADAELEKVIAKMEANRAAAELQGRRSALQKQKGDLAERLQAVTKRLGQLISDDAYTLFAEGLVKRGREITNRLRGEGKIPARVLNTFLQELLERGQCICARHLTKDTPEFQAVAQLLTIAGDQHFNNAVGALDIPTILKGLSGSEYPMVMDSPFGQLGTYFREGVAKWIPSLAPQVVIFASSTQYEGAVSDVLKQSRRVGKRYYLYYHGPKLAANARPELKIDGKRLEQYFESDEEHTEIREIEG